MRTTLRLLPFGLLLGVAACGGSGGDSQESEPTVETTDPLATIEAKPVNGFYPLLFSPSSTVAMGVTIRVTAHIEALGQPAQKGTVLFQFCEHRDGTRVSNFECATGTASWKTALKLPVDPVTGEAFIDVEVSGAAEPVDWGVRFKYMSQGSGIESFTHPGQNLTWVP